MTSDPFGDATVRLSSPADIIAMIPYMLGFHPADSLVIVALRDRRPMLNLRLDLPAATGPTPAEVRDILRHVGQVITEQDADAAILVGYGTSTRVRPVLRRATAELTRRRVPLYDVLRVTDGRYWSYECGDARCCPPEGTPFDVTSSPVAAAATVAGLVALPDRRSLVSQVEPVTGAERVAMRRAVGGADERLLGLAAKADRTDDPLAVLHAAGDEALDAALRLVRAGKAIGDDDLAWLSVLAGLMPVSERFWERIDGNRDEVPVHRTLWLDALRRTTMDLVPAVGSLAAFTAWLDGDGALATAALDRVLDADPEFPPAQVLAAALDTGHPPAGPAPTALTCLGTAERRAGASVAKGRRRARRSRDERVQRGGGGRRRWPTDG